MRMNGILLSEWNWGAQDKCRIRAWVLLPFLLVCGQRWIAVEHDPWRADICTVPGVIFQRNTPWGYQGSGLQLAFQNSPPTIFHLPHLRSNTVLNIHTFSCRYCRRGRIQSLPRKRKQHVIVVDGHEWYHSIHIGEFHSQTQSRY